MAIHKPLVSVIMNCLNCEQYLREAIDSVYAQTYDNWEIIFWDNGSCDQSEDIARSYDSKLRYFKSEVTSILGAARVLAVSNAKGRYFAFLDCDDIWLKEKLEKQMKIFSEDGENLALVYGGCEVLYEDTKEKVINQSILLEGEVFDSLAKENFIPFVSAVVKSEFYHSSGGCTYRFHSDNLSSNNRILAAKEAIQIVSMFLPDKAAEDGLKYHYDNLTIAYIKEGLALDSLKSLYRHGGLFRIFFKLIYKIFKVLRVKS